MVVLHGNDDGDDGVTRAAPRGNDGRFDLAAAARRLAAPRLGGLVRHEGSDKPVLIGYSRLPDPGASHSPFQVPAMASNPFSHADQIDATKLDRLAEVAIKVGLQLQAGQDSGADGTDRGAAAGAQDRRARL